MENANTYTVVTKRLFQKNLLREDETNAFCAQEDIPRDFLRIVNECVKKQGELFVSQVELITEPLSPLAKKMVKQVAKQCGYHVECTNQDHRLEYIESDGSGHYSTDFYHHLQYGCIRVTLAQS